MPLSLVLAVMAAGSAPERLAVHPPLTPSLSKKERQQLSQLEAEVLNTLAKQDRWVLVDESDVAAALRSSGGACPSSSEKLSACLIALGAAVRASASVVVEVRAIGPGRFVITAQLVRREGVLERADETVEVAARGALLEGLLPAVNRLVAKVMAPVLEPPPPPVLTPSEKVNLEVLPPPPLPPAEATRHPLVGPLVSAASAVAGVVAVGLGLNNADRARHLVSRSESAGFKSPPYPLASMDDVRTLQQLDLQATMTVGVSIGAAVLLAAGVLLWLAGL